MESGSDRQQHLRSHLLALRQTVDDLYDARRELTTVLQSEQRAKVEQWAQADPSLSERAKDRLGDYHSLDLSLDIIRLKSEVGQLEDKRAYHLLIIDICRSDLWPAVVAL